jgi:integrase
MLILIPGVVHVVRKFAELQNGERQLASIVRWSECVAEAGLPEGFRFQDLRHKGNTLATSSGASARELMHRMGHASMRAALIYQHVTGSQRVP